MASAHKAISLGYDIVPDHGPSGRLGHWAIAGIPKEAMEVHSKRAAEITEAVTDRGTDTYRSRQVAARNTRQAKRNQPIENLMVRWRAELEAIGHPVPEILASVQEASRTRTVRPDAPSRSELRELVTQTLAPESDLARRKVFNRRDVVVALAPALFGCDPAVLPSVVDRVLGDPEAVPLLGVAEKREQAYATARGIATEQAIAEVVEAMAQRADAPRVTPARALEAIGHREDLLGGHPLTAGQDAAVQAMVTSGRGIDIVVGVAGSGKTTALAAVRDAFSTPVVATPAAAPPASAVPAANAPFIPVGLRRTLLDAATPPQPDPPYDLIGAAVSGQAARTLGSEAGIDPSRTAASILWRLDHNQLRLSDRSVLVLDEAGMADDVTTLRLLTAAERAGAKVVIVGDDRQLPSIGAGGAMGAVLERHPEAVHVLAENVRQRDVSERDALAQLRAGQVAEAVDWYVANDRIVVRPTIEEAREALVAGWARDITASVTPTDPNHGADDDIAMFAWRRVNVAELNRLGRAAWAEMANLSGPELIAPGGAAYAAGDRIVTLAPGARGQLVTSERGSVVSVDVEARTLTALMDDDRTQHFGTEDLAGDRLAHGYAVTVHRSQGLTVDTTHALEDGGGRELAYVRNSRARGATTLYAVADDIEMAAEDLRRSWSNETRQRWAIDRVPATPRSLDPAEPASPALRLARLGAEHEALTALIPPQPEADWHMQSDLNRLRNALRDLDIENAYGVYAGTPLAEALKAWKALRQQRHDAQRHSREAPWLKRPGFARAARDAAEREAPLEAAYRALAEPERARLAPQLAEAEERVASHEAQDLAHHRFLRVEHPEVPRRLAWIEREMDSLGDELFDTRMGLENAMGQGWEHADPTWGDRDYRSLEHPGPADDSAVGRMLADRRTERVIEVDFGPDLGL